MEAEKDKYSTSIVYVKNTSEGYDLAVRVMITYANNEHEALGLAISQFHEEMKSYNVNMSCCIKIEI